MPATAPEVLRLPTGAVTFLFTDIEGSTALWEQYPGAMEAALARHDGLLRDAIASSNGYIVKTTGDGVHAVFGAAADALAASVAAQRRLQAQPVGESSPRPAASSTALPHALRVRMGLHTGTAELRDGDYYGTALNRAARIMSIAHGEQVLLSAETADLVRERLPDGVTLRDMGDIRLKGLFNPERLFQIVIPDLRTDFPPLPILNAHSLPAERDAFVGRREALVELARSLDDGARLISVLGAGGTGKTRLVTRFGWNSLGDFPGGVWFCDLSQARSLDGLVHGVAQGLDVPLGKGDPVKQLGSALAGRGRCLVLLDNFEQVARHAEDTVGRWLDRASGVCFIVTTREVLGVSGEVAMSLPPLALPEGVNLFLQRASSAKKGFRPTAEDEAAIPPLIRLLDGLPLAIELAAARIRIMPPRTLLARMSERFTLLASTGGRPERHTTLRATFDWSWDLLSPPEKSALAQLSVFEGGFTLAAAEALLDLSLYDAAPSPMDAVQSLVEKSLIRQMTDHRFGMLVSVQKYAATHLDTQGRFSGSGTAARKLAESRHWRYFSGLAEQAAVADGCVEIDNLVAACRRAAADGDAAASVDALVNAWAALKLCGPFRGAVELAAVVMAMPSLRAGQRAVVAWVSGSALYMLGEVSEAHSRFDDGLALARVVGDRRCEAQLLCALGDQLTMEGRTDEAHSVLKRALELARELGDAVLECKALNGLGALFNDLGRPDDARVHYQAALDLARKLGDRRWEGGLFNNLGILHHGQGHLDDARQHYEQSLALASETGDRRWEGNTRCNLGLLHHEQGRHQDARVQFETALLMARQLGHTRLESTVLCNLGIVVEAQGQFDEARVHYESAVRAARELRERRSEGQFRSYLGLLYARLGLFDDARSCLDIGERLLGEVSDPISLGLLLCRRAEAEHLGGGASKAAIALRRAEALLIESAAGGESELARSVAALRDLVD